MEQLPTIIGALVLAGILWLLKGTADNTKALAVLQVTTGGIQSTIDNTIQPELVRLRESTHRARDLAQQAVSNTDLLAQRATQNERNIQMLWDGTDRRTGHERRETEE